MGRLPQLAQQRLLVGALTFELFGHLEQVVTDHASWFDAAMAVAAEGVGLTVPI